MDKIRGTRPEYLRWNKINGIYEMYELIGLYQSFLADADNSSEYEDFRGYYLQKKGTTEYHFRNLGVQFIHSILWKNNIKVSKRDMKRFSQTYKYYPVVLTAAAYQITKIMLTYIKREEKIYDIYKECIVQKDDNMDEILGFQSVFLRFYTSRRRGEGEKKWRLFVSMEENLDNIKWIERNENAD